MLVDDAFQLAALERQQGLQAQAQAGFQAGDQVFGHQQVAGAGAWGRLGPFAGWGCGWNADAADGVVEAAVHRHRQVGRQGPGGGGPDRHRQTARGRGCVLGQACVLEQARVLGQARRGQFGR